MPDVQPFEDLFAVPLRNGVSYSAAARGSGVPMVNMREIFAYERIADQECELAPLTDSERATSLLEGGDLLFARQSLTYEGAGKCVLVLPSSVERTWESHLIRVRLDRRMASSAFYFYFFRSTTGRNLIEAIIQQVAAAGIRGSDLRRLPVPVPPLSTQQAIAEVLGALDDKIAANGQVQQLIDDLVGARFEALIEGCTTEVALSTIAGVNARAVRPQSDGLLRYIDIASVAVGRYEFPDPISWEGAPGRARRGVSHGDTLWSSVRPNRRSHALNLSTDPMLVASTGLAVLTPYKVGFAYLYEVTRRPEFTAYLESVAEGSAYPAVRAERFGDALVPLLVEAEREMFETDAAALRELAAELDAESRQLARMRDTLLPELMSGRLRVREAERTVEEVV